MSLEGNQYYFVAYDYDTNAIFAIPIKNLKDESIIAAFDEIFTDLTTKGYKPQFNVTDNQATTPLKKYLDKEDCKWQFVEPTNHRANAAERAIQTFKNHVISGLCTTDAEFPLRLWDKLTEQALITLNIVRTSRIDPSKSAYHQLHGHRYDWNKYPMAPPGTRAVLLVDPTTRESWDTCGIDAWYIGPSFNHYRNCIFFVPETMAYQITASFDLFPQHCSLPKFTPPEHAAEVCMELVESIGKLTKRDRKQILKQMATALQ